MMKKYASLFLVVASFGYFACSLALTPKDGNMYQQELQVLKERRFQGTMLDRKSASGPKNVLVFTENAEQVGFWGMLFRQAFIGQDPIAISSSSMPLLHGYVSAVCRKLDMRVPTIFVTKNKTTNLSNNTSNSGSTKILMSSGAILIGQDLLLDVSQQAVEAAVAHELCKIKHNHDNKEVFMKWIAPVVIASSLPSETLYDVNRNKLVSFLAVRALIAKTFQKQADKFVYADMDNADGLIELCNYWKHAEGKVDADYNDAWIYLKQADICLYNSLIGNLTYFFSRTGHRLDKLQRWIFRTTFLGGQQQYQSRIDAAHNYVAAQK